LSRLCCARTKAVFRLAAEKANPRVSKIFAIGERFRLQALVEGFNVLNHRNNLTKNGSFGAGAYPNTPSATFGQVTAVNEPRVLQAALRLSF